MCLQATCAPLRRLSALSSSAIVLFFIFLLDPPITPSTSACRQHLSCFQQLSPVTRLLHNCHAYEPHACLKRTSEHMTLLVQPEMHKLERTDSKDHMHGL